ncbi:hypothetical protein OR1_00079 [Geobacter sp. OR-1]|uniref:hypothetical protein n=1 Tax=Geobacter sp. OR-1 TaxID=1266765 RepID=UPI000542F3E5|nr:hypothetical protein [Geobacter sp. OR-1]GAM07810.1 hypothetical protein OR1_00079 [Geobacter sp. OR-1]
MKRLASMATLLALLLPSMAAGVEIGADGTTIIRIEERSVPGFAKQTVAPATQYLGFDAEDISIKGLSMHFYGWGRLDLADDSAESTTPRSTDGNFTYGYLQYRFDKANARVKAGRFFVYEGIAAEQIDGVYARTDLNKGFTIAAFGGIPVRLDRDGMTKGKYIGGGRLGYRYGGILDLGVSGLHEADSPTLYGKEKRQMLGGDIWFSPHRMVELSGRSSYNGTTEEIAEHSYLLSVRPVSGLTAAVHYTDIRLKDYFAFTNVPSLFNPNNGDKFRSHGATVSYRITKLPFPAEVSLEYRHFKRDSKGNSDRYGGEIRLTPLDKLNTGVSYARIAAANGIMSYNEARAFAMYSYGRFSVNLDAIGNIYDDSVYGKKDSYEITGGCGYAITPSLRVSGEATYADTPWYDKDVRGLLRLNYSYNSKGAAQ